MMKKLLLLLLFVTLRLDFCLVENLFAAPIYSINYSIQAGYVTSSKLHSMNASDGAVLVWDQNSVPSVWTPTVISPVSYMGTWSASCGGAPPTLTPDEGDYYLVSEAGSCNINEDGDILFNQGDWALYNGTVWQKVKNFGLVTSVFGRTGDISTQANDYTWEMIDKTESSINDLTDVNIVGVPVDGHALGWDESSSSWMPIEVTISSASITLAEMASDSIKSMNILDNTISNDDITSSASISYSKLNIEDGELTMAKTDGLAATLATKFSFTGGSLGGNLDMGNNSINSVGTVNGFDLATINASIVANTATISSLDTMMVANITTLENENSSVISVFGDIGAVVAGVNDYTWNQIYKPNSSLADIADVNISATPITGDLLVWNGSEWEAATPLNNAQISGVELANDSVTTEKVVNNSLTNSDISSTAAIVYSKLYIEDGNLTIAKTIGLLTALADKVSLGGSNISGDIDMSNNNISGVVNIDGVNLTSLNNSINANISLITNTQDQNSALTTIAGLATDSGNFIVANDSVWVTESGSTARDSLEVGTAAIEVAGTGANNLVQLDNDGKIPAVDGSLLTGITANQPEQNGASVGDFLTWNASSGEWTASSLNGMNYRGEWDATSDEAPSLTPASGDYYYVATPGSTNLDGVNSWLEGDYVIYNGLNWLKIGHPPIVIVAAFGRTGDVVAAKNDYTWAQINKTVSSINDIADVDIASAPAEGEVLGWNDTSKKWEAFDKSVLPDSITSNELAGNSVTSDHISENSIYNADISASADIEYSKLNIGAGELTIAKTNGLASSINSKFPLTGGAMNGPLDMNSNNFDLVGSVDGVSLSDLSASVAANSDALATQPSGTVTNVTATLPLESTEGDQPEISISQADSTTPGYLDSDDWNTFSSKQNTINTGDSSQYFRGNLSLATFSTNVLGVKISGFSSGSGVISASDTVLTAINKLDGKIVSSQDIVNKGDLSEETSSVLIVTGDPDSFFGEPIISVSQASTEASGYLSSADWIVFNNGINISDFSSTYFQNNGSSKMEIKDEVIDNSILSDDSIETSKIADGSILGSDISIATASQSGVYSLTSSDNNKFFIASSNATISLPDPAAVGSGYSVSIKNTGNSDVSVVPAGAETIDGQASIIIQTRYDTRHLTTDGINWFIINDLF